MQSNIIEKYRTYYYPNEFHNGTEMLMRFEDIIKVDPIIPNMPHYVYTEDGAQHLVSPGFYNIKTVPYDGDSQEKEDKKED